MRRIKLITLSLGLVLLSTLVFVGAANAQGFKSGDTITVAKTETVDSMLFAAGNNINIAGTVNGVQGPIKDIVIEPELLDITVPAGTRYEHLLPGGHTAFTYILSGEASFDESGKGYRRETILLFQREGDLIKVETRQEPVRFVLASGKPLGEPVAWGGPIVMNSKEELQQAFEEYGKGTFIKQ